MFLDDRARAFQIKTGVSLMEGRLLKSAATSAACQQDA
jgi:hypothetical protein